MCAAQNQTKRASILWDRCREKVDRLRKEVAGIDCGVDEKREIDRALRLIDEASETLSDCQKYADDGLVLSSTLYDCIFLLRDARERVLSVIGERSDDDDPHRAVIFFTEAEWILFSAKGLGDTGRISKASKKAIANTSVRSFLHNFPEHD